MTRPNNIKHASGNSYYSLGYLHCTKCEEWIHKDEKSKIKISKGVGILLHKDCSNQLRCNPFNQDLRNRYHEKIGVKRID